MAGNLNSSIVYTLEIPNLKSINFLPIVQKVLKPMYCQNFGERKCPRDNQMTLFVFQVQLWDLSLTPSIMRVAYGDGFCQIRAISLIVGYQSSQPKTKLDHPLSNTSHFSKPTLKSVLREAYATHSSEIHYEKTFFFFGDG